MQFFFTLCAHTMTRNSSTSAPVLAVLACLLWSTAFVGVKIGLRYSAPFSFAGIRFMLAGLMLVPFWWARRPAWKQVTANQRVIAWVSLFQTFLTYTLFYQGISMVSGAVAAIIIGASPITAALAAHCFMKNDSMTWSKLLILFFGLAGVGLISVSRSPWVSPEGLSEFIGTVLLFFCTVASAVANVLVAKETSDMDPVFFNSVQIFIGGLLLFVLSLIVEGGVPYISAPEYYVALLWLAIVSAVAISLWFVLLQRPEVKISQLNVWKFIIPVFGAVLSWLILPDESPSLVPVLGMVCIAISIIVYNKIEVVSRK